MIVLIALFLDIKKLYVMKNSEQSILWVHLSIQIFMQWLYAKPCPVVRNVKLKKI